MDKAVPSSLINTQRGARMFARRLTFKWYFESSIPSTVHVCLVANLKWYDAYFNYKWNVRLTIQISINSVGARPRIIERKQQHTI